MRYSVQTQNILLSASKIARDLGHGYVGSAHLLLAMVQAPGTAGQLLRQAGVETELTGQMVKILYGVGTSGLPLPQGFTGQMGRILQDAGQEAGANLCRGAADSERCGCGQFIQPDGGDDSPSAAAVGE